MKNKYDIIIELKNLKNEIIKTIKLDNIEDIKKNVENQENYSIKIKRKKYEKGNWNCWIRI